MLEVRRWTQCCIFLSSHLHTHDQMDRQIDTQKYLSISDDVERQTIHVTCWFHGETNMNEEPLYMQAIVTYDCILHAIW